jgi:hypothetical protein
VRQLRICGVDVESKRKGSDWSSGSSTFQFRDLICADLRFADSPIHHFLPFDFTKEQLDKWAENLRSPGLLVVAHNGRYDMNGVNATLVGYGLRPLVPNLLCDTLKDGPRGDGWIRRDLGSMAIRYGVPAKGSVDQAIWDLAHNGDERARAMVKKYNQNDVQVVLALQRRMAKLGLLAAPKAWRP